jgi:Phycobilisome protein
MHHSLLYKIAIRIGTSLPSFAEAGTNKALRRHFYVQHRYGYSLLTVVWTFSLEQYVLLMLSQAFAPVATVQLRPRSRPATCRSKRAATACADTARADAVVSGMASALPPRARELIAGQVAQPIYDMNGPCRAAQNANPPRFLSDAECAELGVAGRAAMLIRDNADDIVCAARSGIWQRHPGIGDEGGGLWPQFRADACWRDMLNFARVASYGCCGSPYLSVDGCGIMDEIYDCLEVPRDAMLTGIKAAAEASRNIANEHENDDVAACVEASYKELVDVLAGMAR